MKVARFPIARLTDWLRRWPVVLAMLVLALGLTGCVEYDVGIHFDNPHRGAIVQRLQIGDRLRGLSQGAVQEWVGTLERRSRAVGGSVQRESDQVLITIPFGSATELETKFNQFFAVATDPAASPDLPAIESHLTVNHSNFVLLEHDRLRYDLDLRSLGVSSSSGSLLLSPGALIDLGFRLETPWGARSVQSANTLLPEPGQPGLTWNLIPGQMNHLEAVFWLPSPLGMGALAIVILVIAGRYLKYPQSSQGKIDSLPDRQPDRQPAP